MLAAATDAKRPNVIGNFKKMQKIQIFILLICFSGNSQHKEYSAKDGYSILKGILLKARSVEKLADSTNSFFDEKPIVTQKFKMKSEITVQVECNVIGGKFEKAIANYTIEIGNDENGLIRKNFAEKIFKYWNAKDESYLNDYKYLEAANHIFYKKGDYVMYIDPQNNNEGNYYLLYFDNKIIKVTFDGFDQNVGWGGLSGFLSELVQFKFKNRTIKTEYKSDFEPKKFIQLHKNKFFDK